MICSGMKGADMIDYQPEKFSKDYATPVGQKLWEVLTAEANIARMETASDLDQPALKPLEDILLDEIGEPIFDDRTKQMAGHMVRQIMEHQGYVHDTSDIKLASVPFYKASRYRRADRVSLYLFKSSKNPRQIGLTDTRDGTKLPEAPDGGKWMFINTLSSPIKAAVGYNLDLKSAVKAVAEHGYLLHQFKRATRVA